MTPTPGNLIMWHCGRTCLATTATDPDLLGVCLGLLVFGLLMLIPGVLLFVLPIYRRLFWIPTRAVVLSGLPPMDDPVRKAQWAKLAKAVAAEAESSDDSPASLLVGFHDGDGGEQFALISRQPEATWASPGAHVTILYQPTCPTRAKLDEFLPTTTMMLCFFGGTLVLAAALIHWTSTGMGR
jgi:hypothetical protein